MMYYSNQGYGSQNFGGSDDFSYKKRKTEPCKTRLVIDDTTIYEVDMVCEKCKRKNDYLNRQNKRK